MKRRSLLATIMGSAVIGAALPERAEASSAVWLYSVTVDCMCSAHPDTPHSFMGTCFWSLNDAEVWGSSQCDIHGGVKVMMTYQQWC